MKSIRYLFSGFGCLLLIASTLSCDDSPTTTENPSKINPDDLLGTTWELRSVSEDGLGVAVPSNDSLFSVTFFADGTVGAKDSCNQCGGEYSADNGEINIDQIFCTEAACIALKSYINFSIELDKVTHFEVKDGELQLGYEENGVIRTLHLVNADDESPKKVIMAKQDGFNRDDWGSGDYRVIEASIYDDTLSLYVGYSGCGPHDFNMVFNSYFLESFPVQARAFLPNKAELCAAAFGSRPEFDLTPLKKAYLESYPEGGSIIIAIGHKEYDGGEYFTIEYLID